MNEDTCIVLADYITGGYNECAKFDGGTLTKGFHIAFVKYTDISRHVVYSDLKVAN
jgi:hypothetical protein